MTVTVMLSASTPSAASPVYVELDFKTLKMEDFV